MDTIISLTISLFCAALAGVAVTVVGMHIRDYLLEHGRTRIAPAIGHICVQAKQAFLTVLNLIQSGTHKIQASTGQAISDFNDRIAGILSKYSLISATKVEITTHVYVFRNGELHESTTGEQVDASQIPADILAKLRERSSLNMRYDNEILSMIKA